MFKITECPPQKRTVLNYYKTPTLIYLPKIIFIETIYELIILYEYNQKWHNFSNILPNIKDDSSVCMEEPNINEFWNSTFGAISLKLTKNEWWKHTKSKSMFDVITKFTGYEDDLELVKIILAKCNENDIQQTLRFCIFQNNIEIVKYILTIYTPKDKDMEYIYTEQHAELLRLTEEYKIYHKDDLFITASTNWTYGLYYILNKRETTTKEINEVIQKLMYLNIKNTCFYHLLIKSNYDKQLLQLAARQNDLNLVTMMIENGADPNISLRNTSKRIRKYVKQFKPTLKQKIINFFKGKK